MSQDMMIDKDPAVIQRDLFILRIEELVREDTNLGDVTPNSQLPLTPSPHNTSFLHL
jgi:hypothetical protein